MILNLPLLGAEQSIGLSQLPLTRGGNKYIVYHWEIHYTADNTCSYYTATKINDVCVCVCVCVCGMNVTDNKATSICRQNLRQVRLSSERSEYLPFSSGQNYMLRSSKLQRASFGNSNSTLRVYNRKYK